MMGNELAGGKDHDNTAINAETGDKPAVKTSSGDKTPNEPAIKSETGDNTGDKIQVILNYIAKNGEVKTSDIMQVFGLKSSQSRYYLSTLVEQGRIEACGSNKNRTYKAI